MADNFTILVGTIGQGMNVSGDSGETWTKIRNPIPSECSIRALRTYPDDPHRILAGTDGLGLFRSDDNGLNWSSVDSPIGDLQVWSVAVDPANTDTIFAGTRPEGHDLQVLAPAESFANVVRVVDGDVERAR